VGSSSATYFVINNGGKIGIGTTTPGTLMSVQGIANFQAPTSTIYSGIQFPAFNATSTTATSTMAGGLWITGGGFKLTGMASNGVAYADANGTLVSVPQGGANTIFTANAGAPSWTASPTIGTQVTVPLVIGGTANSSSLTLESTSGAGTTDAIIFKTASQVEAARFI